MAVQDGDFILRFKPEAIVCYTTQQRLEMVGALKVVDEVCIYDSIDSFIKKVDFDIFAIGEEQNHKGFKRAVKWCEEHGKELVRLERTPGISSSEIKKNVLQ